MPIDEVTVTVDDTRLGPYMQARLDAVVLSIVQAVTAVDIELANYIKLDKLQGQVLQSHTGDLARSVRPIPTIEAGDVIEGGVTAGGGVVNYAGVHEFGVDHPWTIYAKNAQALTWIMNGKRMFAVSVTIPGMPERSYMRSALEEKQAWIIEQIQRAAERGAGGTQGDE